MLRTFPLLIAALAMCACQRATEVEVLSSQRSPDGVRDAVVEEHIYGPHFGGEAPAVEVHIRKVVGPNSEAGMVFQAPSANGKVSVHWLSAQRLEVVHSTSQAPTVFQSVYDGIQVQRRVE